MIKNFDTKLFSLPTNMKQGDIVPIQILKYANRTHPMYGKILIDEKYFNNLIRNFENNVRKDEIPINREHDRTEAQARIKKIYAKDDEMWADIELTKAGAENLNAKHYKYFSAEICDRYQDPDTLKRFENVLVGGAFTNYPYFNGMDKIVASNPSEKTDPNIFTSKTDTIMLKDLLKKFSTKDSLDFSEKLSLTKAFSEATEEEQKENQVEVEKTLNKYSDPEKEEIKKELSQLKEDKKFSEMKLSFSTLQAFSNTEEGKENEEAQKVLKSFSKLSDEEVKEIHAFFSNYQKVVETLTKGQISLAFAKKEEDEKKMSKDGKKKVVSQSEFAKICKDYAKDKGVDVNKAYETLKDEYECESK